MASTPMLNSPHLIPIGRGWSAIKGALIPFKPINLHVEKSLHGSFITNTQGLITHLMPLQTWV